MKRSYKHRHLTFADRKNLESLNNSGLSVLKMSRELNVDRVTVYRELKRGGWTQENRKYDAYEAQLNL